ncbi:MAG: hypothetical protein WD069_18450 [Planctomycetales bacterium]
MTCTTDKAMVAGLRALDIARMNALQLVGAIRAGGLETLRPELRQELERSDRAALVLLVYLARRRCRNEGF